VDELGALLRSQPTLGERDAILPFFKESPDLSLLVGSYFPDLIEPDVLAHEYQLSAHFRADLVVGDSQRGHYVFVELEDAAPDGVFVTRGGRATPEWSPRLEHAFSQVIDWFWILEDMRSTTDFADTFGDRAARFHGLIVIGKDLDLGDREKSRLAWRTDRVVVDSHKISCVSFDMLHGDLDFGLRTYFSA